MRSLGKGAMSATTQVKVLSPEIIHIAMGQGFHVLEASIGTDAEGESVSGVPGSESVAGGQTVCIGTWENRSVPFGSPREAEEAGRGYGVPVFGPTHSRGIGGATPAEGEIPLEGVGSTTHRDGERTC